MDLAVLPYSDEKKLLKGEQLGAGTAHFFIFIHLTLIKLKCIINIIKHKIVFNLILLKEKNNATDSRMDSCA